MNWYRKNQFIEKPKTAREAIEMAGLNWSVEKVPVKFEFGENEQAQRGYGNKAIFPRKFVTYRTDNNQPLGIVGSDYHVVQNNTVFDFIDPIVNDGVVEYYGGGAFNHGNVVWLQLKLAGRQIDLGNDDRIEKYILLLNSHNCMFKLTTMFTPIRIVCQNTLNIAISVAKKRESGVVAMKHCKFMKDKIEKAQKVMSVAVDHYAQVEENYRRMTLQRISEKDLLNYANRVINVKKSNITSKKSVDEIIKTTYGSPGAEKFPGSLWNAYNGVTYYADYLRPNSNKKANTNTLSEESILFGAKARLKTRAYDCAMEILDF